MRFKQICFFTLSCLLLACSDDSSSSSASEEISSSSVSEFSPIVFTKLGKNKLLAGESFKIGFSGTISIDEEYSQVEDAIGTKLDSVLFEVREVTEKGVSKILLSRSVDAEYPVQSLPLNTEEILYDELESCGNFRVYFWAFASGSSNTVYASMDSLDFEKEIDYCEEVEEPEIPESSSSMPEECSEMEMGTIILSTVAGDESRYANLDEGEVSGETTQMQIGLTIFDGMLALETVSDEFSLGEEYGNFRAGVIPDEVCKESLEIYPGTLGQEIEVHQNAWVILKSDKDMYLLLVGKRVDGEGGSSVEITYWK